MLSHVSLKYEVMVAIWATTDALVYVVWKNSYQNQNVWNETGECMNKISNYWITNKRVVFKVVLTGN